jgi:hypothetical protein
MTAATEQQPLLTYHCPHCNATVEARPQDDKVAICQSCKQPFEAALPVVRPEPAPAGILLPPGTEGLPAPQATPVAQPVVAQPVVVQAPAVTPPESPGESIHLSTWRRYPFRCLAYVAAIVASLALGIWLLTVHYQVMAIVVGLGLAVQVIRFGTWALRMHNTVLTITDRRCLVETGLFSRQSTEIGRKDVTDVLVSQDPVMRILNVGDLIIRSDHGGPKEIVLMAIPNPDEVARKIAPIPPPPPASETAGAPSAA